MRTGRGWARRAGRAGLTLLVALACVLFSDAASWATLVGSQLASPTTNRAGWSYLAYTLKSTDWSGACSNSSTGDTVTGPYNCTNGLTYFDLSYPSADAGLLFTYRMACTDGTLAVPGSAASSVTTSQVFASAQATFFDGCSGHGGASGIEYDVKDAGTWKVAAYAGSPPQESTWGAAVGAQFTAPVAWCASTDFTDVAGSYSGTTLAVRFKWLNAKKPAGGWPVYAPDPGSASGTAAMTVSTSATVDGQTGYYYATASLSASPSAMTARIAAAADSSGNPGCSVSLTLSSNAVQSSGGYDTGSSTNSHCHLSFNPIVYFQCLFWPDSSFQQWHDFEENAKVKPPLSLFIGGIPYIQAVFNDNDTAVSCGTQGDNSNLAPLQCPGVFSSDGLAIDQAGNAYDASTLAAMADVVQNTSPGQIYYHLVEVAIAVGFLFLAWRRLAASFGEKG